MRMLLLVTAVSLLVHVAAVSPHLKFIYESAEKCSASQTKEWFVENASQLTEKGDQCGDRFFCRAHSIVRKHEDLCKPEDSKSLVSNLEVYNKGRNVQCEKMLKGMNGTDSQIEFSQLLKDIKDCVQKRNFHSIKK